MIQFPEKIRVSVLNYLTDEEYFLLPVIELEITPERIAEIVTICQQPAIYNNLFREDFADVPYGPAHARDWLERAYTGWRESTHFVFCIVTADKRLAASCELNSAQVDDVEVGYWASNEHRGIMSNALTALLQLATSAGYRSFTASVLHHNYPSKAVLKRCGFVEAPEKKDKTYDYFSLTSLSSVTKKE